MPVKRVGISGIKKGRFAPRTSRKRPQPVKRPIALRQRDLVDLTRIEPPRGELVIHRRGERQGTVGYDPLEARAVSHDAVRGTLPERIFYRALLARGLAAESDWSFQSSLSGGRLELGGMVADFYFPARRLVVRVQGTAWHTGFEAERHDDEQRSILEQMGFFVLDIFDTTIYDERKLEEWLARYIDLRPTVGGFRYYGAGPVDDEENEPGLVEEVALLRAEIGRLVGDMGKVFQDYVRIQ